MFKDIVRHSLKPVKITGVMHYNESSRCRNILRIKKRLLEEFDGLTDKSALVTYSLEYYDEPEQLAVRLKNALKNNEKPFLLFLYKEDLL